MYSVNGRVNKTVSNTISITQKRQSLVCQECGFKLRGVSKEFGIKHMCPKCESTNLEYELTANE
jgi:Zn finger protein HypA/HybF involved in hydrogenase expression